MNHSHPSRSRRQLLIALGLLPLSGLAAAAAATPVPPSGRSAPTEVQVWKGPTCDCCNDWIAHLEAEGFKVFVNVGGTHGARTRLGIPQNMASCHTALVSGYAIKGHVPARDIKRLLREKPVQPARQRRECRSAHRAWTRRRTAALLSRF